VSRRGNGHGTGLGLAIVEAHDGSIEVESPPGSGATFRVRLHGFPPHPRAIAAEPVAAHPVGTSS